jgi:hypothetical protein
MLTPYKIQYQRGTPLSHSPCTVSEGDTTLPPSKIQYRRETPCSHPTRYSIRGGHHSQFPRYSIRMGTPTLTLSEDRHHSHTPSQRKPSLSLSLKYRYRYSLQRRKRHSHSKTQYQSETPLLHFTRYLLYSVQCQYCVGDIFRIENPSVWQIPMFSQIFPMRNMGTVDYVRNVCKQIVYCCLNIP